MIGPHPSFARRVHRWLDRCGRAFVMEVESRDGTRYLIGLDPNWHGAPVVSLAGGDDGDGDRRDPTHGLRVPDDLRDLVP